jgi:hypothetical protein
MISSSSFPARVPDFYAWCLKYRRILFLNYFRSQIWLTFTVDHNHFGYIKNFSGSCTHGIWLWSLCIQTLKGRNKGLWALKETNLEENNAHIWNMVSRLQLGAFCVCMCCVFFGLSSPGSDELAGQFIITMHPRVNGPLDLHTSLLLFDTRLYTGIGSKAAFWPAIWQVL